jgi:hypothetical protein
MFKKVQYLPYFILSTFLVFFVLLIITGDGAYGGADNIAHFRIARYAFHYPRLFFDHWGKPVFTFLMAPAAQVGFKATQIMNVLIGLITMALAVDVLRISSVKFNAAFLFFIAFAPMYLLLMQSCLTEVLLSLFLVSAIWLFLKEKYFLAAIVLSFLPFVRTESIVVIPFFLAAFLWKRKFLTLPLLFSGSLFYAVTGYYFYSDFFWIVHQMPYSTGKSIYGHGGLFDFVKSYNEIIGRPFTLFLVLGILVWSWQIFRNPTFRDKKIWFYILVMGSWITYFAAHSYVWWRGTGGSLGLTRVMAGIIPLAAIPAVIGLNWLIEKIKIPLLGNLLVAMVILWQIAVPFRQHLVPFRWEKPQQLMAQAADYVKGTGKAKIYYFDPFLLHFLNMDPYNQKLNNWGIADKVQPSSSMEINDILVWDAHFGPNEAGVQLQNLMDDPHLELEKAVLPVENFKVLGGYDYGIYVFRKVQQKKIAELKELYHREMNFSLPEQNVAIAEMEGKKCLLMDADMEFSPAIKIAAEEFKSAGFVEILAYIRFYTPESLEKDAVLLILSIENNGKSFSYNKSDLTEGVKADGFQEVKLSLRISSDFPRGSVVNLYIWNKGKKKLLVESTGISVKGY